MDIEFLTVVTVCFNAQNSIKRTLESILAQTYTDFEYLIIDGNSSDKTLEIINSYKKRFINKGIRFRLISEPDKGIYDAMNKGVKYAKGRWIQFFNAGTDFFDSNVLSNVVLELYDSNCDVVYGDFLRVPMNGRVNVFNDTSNILNLEKGMMLSHESTFFLRETHKIYPYNTRINIVADYNTCLKMYIDGRKFKHIPITIINYYEDGYSSRNRVKTINQVMWVRVYNGTLPNNIFTRIKIRLGLYAWKEFLYYYLCPAFVTNLWEKSKIGYYEKN